jgi:hypothetical protein
MRGAAYFRSIAFAAPFVIVAMACSDENAADAVPEDPDASPLAPPDSGTGENAEDSGLDVEVSADVDAGDAGDSSPPRTCTDEGWCHTQVPDAQTLRDVWGDGNGVVWTVSTAGNVLYWDGVAWAQSYAAGTPLYAVWGSSPTDLWAGGDGGLFHGTGASPATMAWTPVSVGAPIRSIWGTSATDIWATGYTGSTSSFTGYVLHYSGSVVAEDAGTGWAVDPVAKAFPTRFTKVWGTTDGEVWLGGQIGTTNEARVLRGRPDGAGGYVWTGAPQTPTGRLFNGAGFISPTEIFLLGLDPSTTLPGYYKGLRTDGGSDFTWTRYDGFKSGNAALNAVWGTGHDDVWVAGALGRLRHWDGNDWHVASTALDDVMPVVSTFYAIWGSGKDDVWIVGDGIALRKIAPQKM